MEPPIPPDDADCCNSCCNPCIFDVYEEKLKKYNNLISNGLVNSDCNLSNCMSETTYAVFKLIEVIQHTEDTYFYTFEYSKPIRKKSGVNEEELTLIYKPGQHFLICSKLVKTKSLDCFTRAYTPIPINNTKPLSFTILIRFYEDGAMSRYIRRLRINSETLWRGPYGNFIIDYTYQHVCLIAQGTGIAPMYAIIKEMLKNEECDTFLKLYSCCRNCDDMLLRNELYELSTYWNFSYEVFVSNTKNINVKYNEIINVGRLGKENLKDYLWYKLDKRIQILICGSESFNKSILDLVLDLNVDSSHIFVF